MFRFHKSSDASHTLENLICIKINICFQSEWPWICTDVGERSARKPCAHGSRRGAQRGSRGPVSGVGSGFTFEHLSASHIFMTVGTEQDTL